MNNSELLEQWEGLCDDETFSDAPYEVETNEHGQILMTPHAPLHSIFQGRILKLINSNMVSGETAVEFPVLTKQGVKTIDVVWLNRIETLTVSTTAPAICVEVLSPSNTKREMLNKRELYFEAGAQEVWICDNGVMSFYDNSGIISRSALCPSFPNRVASPGVY